MTLLGLVCVVAVVDQIDGPMALVELADVSLVDVPVSDLPGRTREGTRLCVADRRRPRLRGSASTQLVFTRARGPNPGEHDDRTEPSP